MKIIKLHDFRTLRVDQTRMAFLNGTAAVSDRLGRDLRDLRISVTDRCNLRCRYCMPKSVFTKDYAFLPRDELLSFPEIERIAKVAVANGVEKIRLTGGEPLLRKNIESLVERLAALRTPDGRLVEVVMTTNGILLASKAKALKASALCGGRRLRRNLALSWDERFESDRRDQQGSGSADLRRSRLRACRGPFRGCTHDARTHLKSSLTERWTILFKRTRSSVEQRPESTGPRSRCDRV